MNLGYVVQAGHLDAAPAVLGSDVVRLSHPMMDQIIAIDTGEEDCPTARSGARG